MLARLALAAVLALVLPAQAPLRAQDTLRIAAVVNDEAISFLDLEARVKLVLISSNVGYTLENRRRAAPQVLRQLIDERLQLQEGKRLSIGAGEEEIKEAFTRIEQQANLPPGGLEAEIRQAGIDRESMVEQMRASIVWQKLMRQRMAPQVQVGDDEVEEILANIKRTKDQPELRISEILLGVDRPEREAEVRRFAEQLADQARGGADFFALARQFSEAASAAAGGEIGWVLPDQLDDLIEGALEKAAPGDVVGPIRTVAGFHIIKFAERRLLQAPDANDGLVNLRQAMFPIAGAAEDEVRRKAAELRSAATCPDFEKRAEQAKAAPPYSLGRLKIADLNATLRPVVGPLAPNKVSDPVKVGDAIAVFMICDRTEADSNMPSAVDVREQLFRGKLSIVARRYLRDLRRAAYLDFRT
jgi:peptidyl-prolyl cis-trans isomerase SurA